MIDMRQVAHPRDVKRYDTKALREDFPHRESVCAGRSASHLQPSRADDRGRRDAVGAAVALAPYRPTGTPDFLARREIGIINIGGRRHGLGSGQSHAMSRLDALYLPTGTTVSFASSDAANPAKFSSLDAGTRVTAAKLIRQADAKRIDLGSPETSNQRTIYQYIRTGALRHEPARDGPDTARDGLGLEHDARAYA